MSINELFSKAALRSIESSGSPSPSSATKPEQLSARRPPPGPETSCAILGPEEWQEEIMDAIAEQTGKALDLAVKAVDAYPTDGVLLHLAGLAAAFEEQPDRALSYLKRLHKRYVPNLGSKACEAIALAQKGRWPIARSIVEAHCGSFLSDVDIFPPELCRWGAAWLRRIRSWRPDSGARKKNRSDRPRRSKKKAKPRKRKSGPARSEGSNGTKAEAAPDLPPLPRIDPEIELRIALPPKAAYAPLDLIKADRSPQEFRLRDALARLSLFKGFDDLLCASCVKGVDQYWYQTETVRKTLKQFRGRVLLADEVGLGKTVEAGMILKEYLLRGMVERVLILVPPSLVGQWREEMESKFDIDFITTHDPLLKRDPQQFWSASRIIASIATARTVHHFKNVTRSPVDLVIVDEAHHLKNRTSKNWKLVDSIQKRFLLLLSATPVQNNLVELYNLLTLLKPGLFNTEQDFRTSYVTPGRPRVPVNTNRLRDLMRDAMIRNTRALVDVHLPPRHALTSRLDPLPEEQRCYEDMCRLIRGLDQEQMRHHRSSLHHLVQAAGSSAAAATAGLRRFIPKLAVADEWHELCNRYAAIAEGPKTTELLRIIGKNPEEKKMVFVRYAETLKHVARRLSAGNVPFVLFHGRMNGQEKDKAIDEFRQTVPVLVCTESGAEGRNVQFCNTLINYDLSWNPQAIEQRIGRIHRIGQQRDVFIFNLAVKGTVEDRIIAILDEKINMFELVVGEIQSILGEMEGNRAFEELVMSAWLEQSHSHREAALDKITRDLTRARDRYEQVKLYDDELFGDDLEAG